MKVTQSTAAAQSQSITNQGPKLAQGADTLVTSKSKDEYTVEITPQFRWESLLDGETEHSAVISIDSEVKRENDALYVKDYGIEVVTDHGIDIRGTAVAGRKFSVAGDQIDAALYFSRHFSPM